MARTLLRVMRGEFAFYLTEGSKGGKKGGARWALYRTSGYGKIKDGFVFVNSGDRARLLAMTNDGERMDACQALFDSKKRRATFGAARFAAHPAAGRGLHSSLGLRNALPDC